MTVPPQTLPKQHQRVDNTRLGITSMLLSVLFFSVMNVLAKLLMDRFPVNEVMFFRSLFALIPVCLVIHFANGFAATLRTRYPWGHLGRSLIGLSAMVATFWSFHLLPLGDAISLNFAAPLFLTALSVPLLGEKVGIHRWSAVLVGFAGVLIIVQPSGDVLNLGAMLALGGALCTAVAMIAIRQLSRTELPNTIVFYFTLLTTVMTGLSLPVSWITPGPLDLLLLLATGLCGGCGQLMLTRAYSLAPAAVVAPLNYASLLLAVGFGWLLWGEVPTGTMAAGAAVVMASGLYILYRETQRGTTVTKPLPAGEGD
ncbi:Permease of the drug/metabolite transporter (DMT) superfamily [Azospirillum oryzae]|uniref:Permease of the drug/metabolite transporter (DMT) superfamily n=1 Tax=Azospirillum oryzae TaxID=286727 RepID=A0A1X7HIY6_9PROT|nr:DMT family transporter [Azospirillum oryzae]SMF87400.1 Permease of the drug/metabolite transporter (DMT) superfamily [Azospirillum oryzae]